MDKIFFENFFTPVLYIQNDQRVVGIILRCVCWGTHRPPPPPRGARRLTTRPAGPQGLGQPRGGGSPPPYNPPRPCAKPPPYNPQNGCTPLGVTHWLAAAPVLHVDWV